MTCFLIMAPLHIASNDKQLLHFSRNCVFDTVITGAHHKYEVTTLPPRGIPRITSVCRINSETDEKHFVGEINWKIFKPSIVKLGGGIDGEDACIPLKDFVRRQGGSALSRQVKPNAVHYHI